MSRRNKVNKTNYVQAGRLTPDDMARERRKMEDIRGVAADEPRAGAKRSNSGDAATARGESAPSRRRSGREE